MSDVLLSEENLLWRDRARAVADECVRPVAAKHDHEVDR